MDFSSLSFLNLIMSIQIQVSELQLPFCMELLELTVLENFILCWLMLLDRSFRRSSIICLINHLIELLFSFNKALLLVPREGATSIGQIGLTFHVVFFLFRGKRNCLFNKLLANFMYKLFCQLYM